MKIQGLTLITPSRCSTSAMSRLPARAGMLTILSSLQRPRRFQRLLAVVIRGAGADHQDDQGW